MSETSLKSTSAKTGRIIEDENKTLKTTEFCIKRN